MSKTATCFSILFLLTLAHMIVVWWYPSKTAELTSMQVFHLLLVVFQFFTVLFALAVLGD